uniref:Retrovirus-related Env polyprotein from copia-like transposable element 17.6 n=1 Tax=Ceratitis capitata TaxID=7213 RepID=W8ACE9_CERCA
MAKITIILAIITTINALLQINKLENETGYAKIRIREVEIVNQTTTVIHIIHPKEFEEIVNKIENNLETNFKIYDRNGREMLYEEIKIIKAKINTLMPIEEKRKRRGLINIIIIILLHKWLFGTMDNEDRENILQHLEIIDKNNHNIIGAVNQQIYINDNFNKSINILKRTIENDRIEIIKTFEKINGSNEKIMKHMLYSDQMFTLKHLENKIEQIRDNIASARHNILHPSILSTKEIERFNINIYKLKHIETGLLSYDDSLLLAIKIPITHIKAQLTLITPLPNSQHFEIKGEQKYAITIGSKIYKYKEGAHFKNLKEFE